MGYLNIWTSIAILMFITGLVLILAVYKAEDKKNNKPEKNKWASWVGYILLFLAVFVFGYGLFLYKD